jgi:hypothetical protein
MRIWDIEPHRLCRKHLLGEHRELHALYSILLHNKKGYRSHPETMRWVGKLPALYKRHEMLVVEMEKRGYNHLSPLQDTDGESSQKELLHTIVEQEKILQEKACDCLLTVIQK